MKAEASLSLSTAFAHSLALRSRFLILLTLGVAAIPLATITGAANADTQVTVTGNTHLGCGPHPSLHFGSNSSDNCQVTKEIDPPGLPPFTGSFKSSYWVALSQAPQALVGQFRVDAGVTASDDGIDYDDGASVDATFTITVTDQPVQFWIEATAAHDELGQKGLAQGHFSVGSTEFGFYTDRSDGLVRQGSLAPGVYTFRFQVEANADASLLSGPTSATARGSLKFSFAPECTSSSPKRPGVADCNVLAIQSPRAGDWLFTGSDESVRWTGSPPLGVSRLVVKLFDERPGDTEILGEVDASTGRLDFKVPEMLSRHARVGLFAVTASGEPLLISSDQFTVRGRDLTKVDATTSEFVPYTPGVDNCSVTNGDSSWWPPTWFAQFDYQHTDDPNTNAPYPQDTVFGFAPSALYPDWPLFVRVFGRSACYWDAGTFGRFYKSRAIDVWFKEAESHDAECAGISVASLLYYLHPEALRRESRSLAPLPNESLPGAANFHSFDVNALRAVVAGLQLMNWVGDEHYSALMQSLMKTPSQTVEELRLLLADDAPELSYLHLRDQLNGSGSHAVVAYQLRQDSANPNIFNIFVADPNDPSGLGAPFGEPVVVDVSANGGRGKWSYNGFSSGPWGGDDGLCLADPVVNFLEQPTLRETTKAGVTSQLARIGSPFATASGILDLSMSLTGSTLITDGLGDSLGFVNGRMLSKLPGGTGSAPFTGHPGPPTSYRVPEGTYSIEMSGGPDSLRLFSALSRSTIFTYQRNAVAAGGDVDHLAFDGGLAVRGEMASAHTVRLEATADNDTDERTWTVSGLVISGGDSLHLGLEGRERARLANAGAAKVYTLQLTYGSNSVGARFRAQGLVLPANTTHTITADWGSPRLETATILVDTGNDGTVDDTLHVANEIPVVVTGTPGGGGPRSRDFALVVRNWDRRVGGTRVEAALAKACDVRLVVFDVLGRQVRVLADGQHKPGELHVLWDGQNRHGQRVGSGVYLIRLDARPTDGSAAFARTVKTVITR